MSTSYRAGPCADTSHVDADMATASAEMRRNARGLRMQLMPEMVTLLLSHRQMAVARKLPSAWRNVQGNERRNVRVLERVRRIARTRRTLPPPETAKVAGLRYVNDETMPGIRRIGRANRFRYVDANGRTVADRIVLQRIRALAIPPAWTDVWICSDPNGHVQATGRDARGRKQYRYHPRWREVRDEVKYGRMIPFAHALAAIRRRTTADLRKSGLPRERVLAAVVQLLEKTLIRVGNEEYARQNHSFGLTTMRDQHARINGSKVHFEFRGKSGIRHAVDLHDRRLARIVKACRDLPGYELFQYVDEHGARQVIDSADVNDYLREITGQPFTAKDFRTWAGTVLAAEQLAACEPCKSAAHGKRMINRAVEAVARRLGNTKAVCRKSYIHPAIFEAYLAGRRLSCDEAAVIETIRGATIIARCRRAS
jgi:DNA topoisomerase I